MVVHCSKMLKIFNYSTTIVVCFLVLVVQKIALWLFNTTNNNALMQLLLKPNENMEKKKFKHTNSGPSSKPTVRKTQNFNDFSLIYFFLIEGAVSLHTSVEVDNFREKNQRIFCFLAPRICYCYVTLSVAHVVEWQPWILRRHTWSCAFGKVMKWVCKY